MNRKKPVSIGNICSICKENQRILVVWSTTNLGYAKKVDSVCWGLPAISDRVIRTGPSKVKTERVLLLIKFYVLPLSYHYK